MGLSGVNATGPVIGPFFRCISGILDRFIDGLSGPPCIIYFMVITLNIWTDRPEQTV